MSCNFVLLYCFGVKFSIRKSFVAILKAHFMVYLQKEPTLGFQCYTYRIRKDGQNVLVGEVLNTKVNKKTTGLAVYTSLDT
jgi:hypothetical protein